MTLNIAICDDNKDDIELLKNHIMQYNIETENNIITSSFSSSNEFINSCNTHIYNVVLLDIEMPEINGMDLAKQLRTKSDDVFIIFTTSYPEYMHESFEVQPFQYLIKPINYKSICTLLENVIKKITRSTKNVVIVDTEGEKQFIPLDDILYISSIKGKKIYIRYQLTTAELITKGTLVDIESFLNDKGFISPSRGYIVNLRHIRSINSEYILLKNGFKTPISRRRLKVLQQIYAKYIIELI